MASKKEAIGEILKDQAITNLELLYDELIGDDYLAKDINKMQDNRRPIRNCLSCENFEKGSCKLTDKEMEECIRNKWKYYAERKE